MAEVIEQKKRAGGPSPVVGNDPLNPQNIQVILVDHKRDEKEEGRQQHPKQDFFNRCLNVLMFLFKVSLLVGLGIACITLSQTRECSGEPGLLTFIWGLGVTLVWLGLLVIVHFQYFQYHMEEHAGQLFRLGIALTQTCIFGLAIYGVFEAGEETVNRGIQSALIANGVGDASQYSCDNEIYEISLVGIVVSFAYVAGLVYRICNYWKINTSVLSAT